MGCYGKIDKFTRFSDTTKCQKMIMAGFITLWAAGIKLNS